MSRRIVVIPGRRFGGQFVPSSRVKKSLMEQIGSTETSVRNCHYTLRYVPQQRRSRLLRGGRLKSSSLLVPNLSPIPAQLLSPYFFNIHFNISSHLRLGLVSDLFPSGFPIKMVLRIYLSRLNNSKLCGPPSSRYFHQRSLCPLQCLTQLVIQTRINNWFP